MLLKGLEMPYLVLLKARGKWILEMLQKHKEKKWNIYSDVSRKELIKNKGL